MAPTEERKAKILVVEDDPSILLGVTDTLEGEGFVVVQAKDGESGWRLARSEDPDLYVLDVMLPRMSGVDLCRKLHEERVRGAKLLLTAKAAEIDKVKGFQAGADDYLTKPFSILELLLRVRALLRRVPKAEDRLAHFTVAGVEIDWTKLEALRGGERIDLTPREFKILRLLCESPGRVVSRHELLDKVWGYDHFPTTRTVDNHIVKLRKAIEPDPSSPRFIVSIRGVGYKLDPEGKSKSDEE